MSELEDFIKHPKTDAHNHLNLGMRYASYVPWARFLIPNFPRTMNGLAEMHEVISTFTRPRCSTAEDVRDVISLSIEDAIADSVTVLEGSIDLQFVGHYNEDYDAFLGMISGLVEKYKDKIIFRPELGIGKTFDDAKVQKWVPILMKSGVFKSVDLYGPETFDGLERFTALYELAGKLGLKRKAHVGEFSDAASVKKLVEEFSLEEVQHGIGAAKDDKVLQFLADKKIRCNVTPTSNVLLSAVKKLEDHPIKKMFEAGVRLSIGTDDLLFFNRSVSEECLDLENAGVLTKEQIFKILDDFEK
ncbi:MAG: adenosine deaminase [Spirochaetaceae bacterium]|nr:adenosine deaminase [Spirochaetaceae bacterium]